MALLLSILILTGYFYLIFSYTREIFNEIFTLKIIYSILYLIIIIIPGLLLVLTLSQEKFIYYWDYSGYWVRSINFTKIFFESPFFALEEVYNTIRHNEYNFLSNLFISPINKLFGLSFKWYVFSIYLVFLLPLALLISNLILLSIDNFKNKILKLALPVICILFTPFLIPIRFGFIDIIGLIFIFLILNIIVKKEFLRNLDFKSSILIGVLLLILVFSRRWYSFWVVSFFGGMFITCVIYLLRTKDWKSFKFSIINVFIIGSVTTLLMLCFFYPFFEMSVLKDYNDIYSAYNRSTTLKQFDNFNIYFGYIILIFFLIGGLVQFKKKKRISIFLIVSTLIIIFLFTRINDFGGYQHYYLVLPIMIIFILRGLVLLPKYRNIPLISILIFLIVNNVYVFYFNNSNNSNTALFSNIDGTKKVRLDFDAIQKMADDILFLEKNNEKVYIISSSKILNDGIVKNTKLPKQDDIFTNVLKTEHVDKRDKFPNDFLEVNYVIVTNPSQYHLKKEDQYLIGYFNDAILNGILKKNFQKVNEYILDNNVSAFLMKKINPYTLNQLNEMQAFFKQKYPDNPLMYQMQKLENFKYKIESGDNYGKVVFENDTTIRIQPGATKESSIYYTLEKKYSSLSFVASFINKEDIIKNCNKEKDGEVELIIEVDDNLLEKYYVTYKNDIPITVNLKNKNSLNIRVNKGKYKDYCDWFVLNNFNLNKK